MSNKRRIGIRVGVGVGLIALTGLLGVAHVALPILTGYTAKVLGSGVFVARRGFDAIMERDVEGLASRLSWEMDPEDQSVTVSFHGLAPRTAVYHEGLGVTLLPIGKHNVLFEPDFTPTPPPRRDSAVPWPAGEVTSKKTLEADVRARLDKAVGGAFVESDPEHPRRTRAVIVVHNGQIIAERYGNGIGVSTPLLGWSMTKSIVNALTGILVRQEKLSLARPAPVEAWMAPGDPRSAITLNMMLHMSTGLAFNEDYGNPFGDALPMLFKSEDFGAYAAAKPLVHPPGEVWAYSSGTTNLLSRILRDRIGGDTAYYFDFPRVALFNKIGMESAILEPDPSGTFVGSSYCYATARDWARFGQFYLQDGVWNGERILPEDWVTYSRTPAPKAPKGCYGAHWWTNAGDPGNPENRPMPSLPPDLFYASGHEGQFVVVVPSRNAVLVRLGATRGRPYELETFVHQILEALPEG